MLSPDQARRELEQLKRKDWIEVRLGGLSKLPDELRGPARFLLGRAELGNLLRCFRIASGTPSHTMRPIAPRICTLSAPPTTDMNAFAMIEEMRPHKPKPTAATGLKEKSPLRQTSTNELWNSPVQWRPAANDD